MNADRREEAARWIIALDRRVMTQEDRAAYEAWRQDPANAAAMAEVRQTWLEMGALGDPGAATAEYPPELNRRMFLSRSARVAAVTGFGALGLGALYRYSPLFGSSGSDRHRVDGSIVEETGIGEQRSLLLADGSIANLNVASRLKYWIGQSVRKFELLSGQAEFIVSTDPNRPFIVHAQRRGLRTFGGVLDVKLGPALAEVAVREGEVVFSSTEMGAGSDWPGNGLILHSGEMIGYAGLQMTAARTIPLKSIGEWRDRIITFNSAPLRDVVRELNEYFPGRISLQDAELGEQLVTLRLYVVDRSNTLETISKLLSLKVVLRGDEAILTRMKQPV